MYCLTINYDFSVTTQRLYWHKTISSACWRCISQEQPVVPPSRDRTQPTDCKLPATTPQQTPSTSRSLTILGT
ncbi:hypothetical protein CDL15_Pgr000075 [Punica granatum]|uniref:Uncharacterized protein n=1 Tax=Punica granatum TaxID=22663 RepID=A0A218VQC9_PUNGR|nr:hypothetical protein CDL15_Pgr000075 [Punica granatum]